MLLGVPLEASLGLYAPEGEGRPRSQQPAPQTPQAALQGWTRPDPRDGPRGPGTARSPTGSSSTTPTTPCLCNGQTLCAPPMSCLNLHVLRYHGRVSVCWRVLWPCCLPRSILHVSLASSPRVPWAVGSAGPRWRRAGCGKRVLLWLRVGTVVRVALAAQKCSSPCNRRIILSRCDLCLGRHFLSQGHSNILKSRVVRVASLLEV